MKLNAKYISCILLYRSHIYKEIKLCEKSPKLELPFTEGILPHPKFFLASSNSIIHPPFSRKYSNIMGFFFFWFRILTVTAIRSSECCVPCRSGESKISPTTGIALPFEDPAIRHAGVGAFSIRIEREALRSHRSGQLDNLCRVELVVGPRYSTRRKGIETSWV